MPYHRLEVYRKAYRIALEVHGISLGFPKIEQYGLAQQMRGSSKSIAANIAEGMGKQESPADVRRFLRIAISHCDWIVRRNAGVDRICERSRIYRRGDVDAARRRLPGNRANAKRRHQEIRGRLNARRFYLVSSV